MAAGRGAWAGPGAVPAGPGTAGAGQRRGFRQTGGADPSRLRFLLRAFPEEEEKEEGPAGAGPPRSRGHASAPLAGRAALPARLTQGLGPAGPLRDRPRQCRAALVVRAGARLRANPASTYLQPG